jgi:hypothetical protein
MPAASEIVTGSVYEQEAYLAASAEHVGAAVEHAHAGGAGIPLLRHPDGRLSTVYGIARPYGDYPPDALGQLAHDLTVPGVRLHAVLSPLHPGPAFARELVVRGGQLVGERPICVADLDAGDTLGRRARRSVATAHKRGASTEVTPLPDWFGRFYREAMGAIGAEPIYLFGEGYFAAMATLEHYLVTVRDEHGVAAAALFLTDGSEAHYHLGGRRPAPEPVVGAMSLALAEGIGAAREHGCRIAVLGGGRSDRPDDALFQFKWQLATRALPRFSVRVGPREPA